MIFVQKASTIDSAMKGALKNHIMRKRQRLKQEMEQDAIEKRLKKEREQQRRQDAMTLDQIKEQLAALEKKLNNLKDEKHNLFAQLKKVLNEEVARQKQREAEILAASQAQQGANHANQLQLQQQQPQQQQQMKIEEIHQQQQSTPITLVNNTSNQQSIKPSKDVTINQPRMPIPMPHLYPYHLDNHVPPHPHLNVLPPRQIGMYSPRMSMPPMSMPVSGTNMRMSVPLRPMIPIEQSPSRNLESNSNSNSLKRAYPGGSNDPRDQLVSSPRKSYLSQHGQFHLTPPQPPQLRANPPSQLSSNRMDQSSNGLKNLTPGDRSAQPRRSQYESSRSSHESSPNYQGFGSPAFAYQPTPGLPGGPLGPQFYPPPFNPKDLKDLRVIQPPFRHAPPHATSRLTKQDYDRSAQAFKQFCETQGTSTALHSPHANMILNQPGQIRPGGITSGFPLLRRGGSGSSSSPGPKTYNSPR